jgi:hypothetical protein
VLSSKKRALCGPTMASLSARPEFISIPSTGAEALDYHTDEYLSQRDRIAASASKVGALDFGQRPEREFHAAPKPFQVPESKDLDKLERAEHVLGSIKKVKGLVDIDKTKSRDEHMIYNFSNDDLKLWRRAKSKKQFKFSDYIPNTIKKAGQQLRLQEKFNYGKARGKGERPDSGSVYNYAASLPNINRTMMNI